MCVCAPAVPQLPLGPEQDHTKVLQPLPVLSAVLAPGPAGVTSEKGPLLAPYCIADIPGEREW